MVGVVVSDSVRRALSQSMDLVIASVVIGVRCPLLVMFLVYFSALLGVIRSSSFCLLVFSLCL